MNTINAASNPFTHAVYPGTDKITEVSKRAVAGIILRGLLIVGIIGICAALIAVNIISFEHDDAINAVFNSTEAYEPDGVITPEAGAAMVVIVVRVVVICVAGVVGVGCVGAVIAVIQAWFCPDMLCCRNRRKTYDSI